MRKLLDLERGPRPQPNRSSQRIREIKVFGTHPPSVRGVQPRDFKMQASRPRSSELPLGRHSARFY